MAVGHDGGCALAVRPVIEVVADGDVELGKVKRRPGEVLARTRYERCRFSGVTVVGVRGVPFEERSVVREVAFVRCRADNGWRLYDAVLDEVLWERPRGEIWSYRCAFRHVRLVGPVPRLWVDQDDGFDEDGPRVVAQNAAFHAEVDWCLDLREAELRDIGFRGLDPTTVVVDPERQAFVSAEGARRAQHLVPSSDELPGWITNELRILGRADRAEDRGPVFLSVLSKGRHAAQERELVRALHEEGLTLPTYDGPL